MSGSDTALARLVTEQLQKILASHTGPETAASVKVTIRPDGNIMAVVESAEAHNLNRFGDDIEKSLCALTGVGKATVIFTLHDATKKAPQKNIAATATASAARPDKNAPMPHNITHIVAVASAKGGVGKSTVAVNLALSAARKGLAVGLMDSDIHGPSIPIMLGTQNSKHTTTTAHGKKLLTPIPAHGIQTASMGYVADASQAMVWRGPMVSSALWQLYSQMLWGDLDMLVIDTPPGTGDVLLTLAQKLPLAGVVIVTTPQEVARADVNRGAALFHKTDVPLLGVIENMSWFDDPDSGRRSFLFGQGGGQKTADAFGVPLLGHIPLDPEIGIRCDSGRPVVVDHAAMIALYADIADALIALLPGGQAGPAAESSRD